MSWYQRMKKHISKKDIGLSIALVIIFFILIYITIPKGKVYGSQTDWLSQHVGIAETLRDEILNQDQLLLDFVWLGGGSNAYNFSYYGYLRPDVLVGCILKDLPMETILVMSMIVSFLSTVLLCYIWLRLCKLSAGPSFLGAFFCMTSACFFHFHRQIMFVNYMPFLFLALILVPYVLKKKSILLYCFILSAICFQSYYYSISCFIVIIIYWFQQMRKKEDLWLLFKMLSLSIGAACILLLPTFLALLENKRASLKSGFVSLIMPKIELEGLLYSPYGIGFSVIILYLLIEGILHKKYRKISIFYVLLFVFPIVPYLLNGTLYARYKILMPFLPIILLHSMKILQGIWDGEIKPSSRLAFIIICINIMIVFSNWDGSVKVPLVFSLIDLTFILIFSWLWKWKNKSFIYILLLITPVLITIVLSAKEEFVEYEQGADSFTERELRLLTQEEWARTDFLRQPLINANKIRYLNQKTTGMYSSVTNKKYADFYYNIMHTPIRINNRVALLPEVNPFLQNMMGVRYVVTNKDKVPYGYTVIKEKEGSVLAENDRIMPLAYLSTKTLDQEKFEKLSFPYTLETLTQYTVVERVESEKFVKEKNLDCDKDEIRKKLQNHDWERFVKYTSMQRRNFVYEVIDGTEHLEWKKKNGGIEFEVQKDTDTTIKLDKSLKNWIGIISFDVVNKSSLPVEIAVNGIRNKLSGRYAPYPNENKKFTFFIDENMDEKLEISIKKGKFRMENFKYYAYPRIDLMKKDLKTVSFHSTRGNQVLNCYTNYDEDSYFVTSIPYQEGMEIYVDGEQREVEIVNTAFVGTVLEAGLHEVEVKFVPPGKRFGIFITSLSFFAILALEFKKRFYLVKESDIQK